MDMDTVFSAVKLFTKKALFKSKSEKKKVYMHTAQRKNIKRSWFEHPTQIKLNAQTYSSNAISFYITKYQNIRKLSCQLAALGFSIATQLLISWYDEVGLINKKFHNKYFQPVSLLSKIYLNDEKFQNNEMFYAYHKKM